MAVKLAEFLNGFGAYGVLHMLKHDLEKNNTKDLCLLMHIC
jgi:hypothetical protein